VSIEIVSEKMIEDMILLVRGEKVIVDRDIARLYGVPTKVLNQAVKRNIKRFPPDFMLQMTDNELKNWRAQIVTSNSSDKMGLRRAPYLFTEQGIAMLSSVLNSEKAVQINIGIMRVFVRLRHLIDTHHEIAQKISQLERKYDHHDFQIQKLFDRVREIPLLQEEKSKKVKGFIKEQEKE